MKERDSNIELLRILATIFILILHCNGWFLREWGGISCWNTGNSIVAACRILIQNITVLGVDVFILISGFYGIHPKLKSIVNLFTLLFFFYTGCYLWACSIGHETFSYAGLFVNMKAFSRTNWFISGYLFLMLLAPMINAFADSANLRSFELYIVLYCVVTLYLGYYQGNEYWWYNAGYSVTMMVGVYIVGRYLHRVVDNIDQIKYWNIAVAFIGVIGLMSIIRILSSNEEAWLHYGSPITIFASVLLLFYRIPKFKNKFVNWIAASCLASFILHTCEPVFSWFVRKDVMYFSNDSYPVYCIKIGGVIIGVYVASILLDKVRLFIFSPLIKWSGKIKQLN